MLINILLRKDKFFKTAKKLVIAVFEWVNYLVLLKTIGNKRFYYLTWKNI